MKKNPNHIAIIMDGNGRWAEQRKLTRYDGHRAGVNVVKEIVEYCVKLGIKYLTLYTFSMDNWSRPKTEILNLIKLLIKTLDKEINLLIDNKIKFTVIGNLKKLDLITYRKLKSVENKTKNFSAMNLNLAISYSGREELINAINNMLKNNIVQVNEKKFSEYLYTKNLPDPDLLIRTGGEYRLSNFLLWQVAYSELYFTNILWPDYNIIELDKALLSFKNRERRYGKTSKQIYE